MEAAILLEALKKKLKLKTDRDLSEAIGITQVTLIDWKKNKKILNANQVASIIKKSIHRSKQYARQYSIKPLVEYYPIEATESKQGAKWEILDTSILRERRVRDTLHESHGIYVFYNSQCRAIYVGKANRRNLWGEMNGAFNRKRDAQVVWQVRHPSTGDNFTPAFIKARRIAKHKVYLHDIAHYFSAYSIEKDLIDNAEALLIRVFANDLTNLQMENIKLK